MTASRFAGIMSGTSLDGVDAAVFDFDDDRIRTVARHHVRFDDALHGRLLALATGHYPAGLDPIDLLGIARRGLTECYARAIEGMPSSVTRGIDTIGAHGQTIRHRPESRFTLQLLDGALLAELTGHPVVCDFRSGDVAAGGQGAPLVPPFHAAVFAAPGKRRAIVNIGGIANATVLDESGAVIAGFDTGPGNRLLDDWCRRHRGHDFDDSGRWASTGQVNNALLAAMRAHPFLAKQPPKSTGREEFNLEWLDRLLPAAATPSTEDVQATLAEYTAATITDALAGYGIDEIVLCGGGARNADLVARIVRITAPRSCTTTDDSGLDAQSVECAAFAWLARRRVCRLAGNLPAATGARHQAILGALYLPHAS